MSYDVTRTTLQSMTHIPPPAEELRLLDAELWQLDTRRAWLVATLQKPQTTQPTPMTAPRPETSAPSVQNLLLLLGGVLLTIAAMVFTLVSWGHLGITGRALVLGAVTLATLAVPAVLLKRGLRSTAESVAGLGLALTVLDAYALHEAALPGTDGTGYAALASAVLAGLWAAYGLLPVTAGLRLPLPAASAAAQFPLALWALAAGADAYGITAALLVTAGLDTGAALRVTAGSVRVVAAVGAYGTGSCGVLAAGWLSWRRSSSLRPRSRWPLPGGARARGGPSVSRSSRGCSWSARWAGRCVPRCRRCGRSRSIWRTASPCWRRFGPDGCRTRCGRASPGPPAPSRRSPCCGRCPSSLSRCWGRSAGWRARGRALPRTPGPR
jgi:hypothetical protein